MKYSLRRILFYVAVVVVSLSGCAGATSAAETGGEQCVEMCQWYQDEPRPLCENQDSGWGWENQQSCIGRTTCNDQYGDGGVISVCSSSSAPSSSLASSSLSSSEADSSSSSSQTGGNSIVVRMVGVTGEESVSLEVGGQVVQTWTLTTTMSDYSVLTNASGEVRVAFTNDAGDRDVQVDYVELNGEVRHAEDQADNTGAWDGECGGGSYSEMLHCNGSIGFGNINGGVASSSSSGNSSSSASSSSSNNSAGVENSGSHCAIPDLASYSELPAIAGLPNPFESIDGSTIASADDWTCRRAEISAQAQYYELGEKPAPDASVSGSGNGSSITVNVQENGQSISFTAAIDLPTSGQAPYPAVIGMGGSSLNNSALSNQGVAVITFPNNEIAAQVDGGSRGQGKFYELYGSNHSAGAMAAWAWGVSRLIDALEQTPNANIDASRLGMTGCSRNGKGALMAGALDERIKLTIPQESGSGGSAAWRVSDAQQDRGENVQTLSQIVTENVWFRESFSEFANSAERLPFDHHAVMGLVAPRGLLVLENTDMEWLGNESTYTASVVARGIWEALGVPEHMGVSQLGGYSHCQFPSSQQAVLDAFIARFLLDTNAGSTEVVRTDGNISVDFGRWVDWQTPSLQ